MRIRAAQPNQTEELGRIACAAKGAWGYSAAQIEEWHEDLVPTAESVRNNPTFVAQADNQIAGFCQLDVGRFHAQLEHMWVDPQFMRMGIGRALLVHVMRQLKQKGIVRLDIDADPNAAPFYTACGATLVGLRAAPIEGQPDRTRPQLRLVWPERAA
jgi:ribosomal protein S18 acetylase RimI-like enzyme